MIFLATRGRHCCCGQQEQKKTPNMCVLCAHVQHSPAVANALCIRIWDARFLCEGYAFLTRMHT